MENKLEVASSFKVNLNNFQQSKLSIPRTLDLLNSVVSFQESSCFTTQIPVELTAS